MNFVAKIMGLALALTTFLAFSATASAVTTVTAQVVSSNVVLTSAPLVVKFTAVTTAATAPQAVALRVRFDETNLLWLAVTDNPNDVAFASGVTYASAQTFSDLGTPSTNSSTQTDGGTPANYRDVATIGSATFPATNTSPVCFYVKFEVTAAGGATGATYDVDADIISASTNHFPFLTVVPPAIGTLDANDATDLVFVPANITAVEDWTLLAE